MQTTNGIAFKMAGACRNCNAIWHTPQWTFIHPNGSYPEHLAVMVCTSCALDLGWISNAEWLMMHGTKR